MMGACEGGAIHESGVPLALILVPFALLKRLFSIYAFHNNSGVLLSLPLLLQRALAVTAHPLSTSHA